jgi:hypothetical protein
VVAERPGAGSIPAFFKISHTVEGATFTPSASNSPCTRRYPHAGFSRARRRTKTRTERTVRGRPGRAGLDRAACRFLTRSRVPAQHRVRAYQQPHPVKRLWPQPVQQRRQQDPVRRREAHLPPAQLALQHRDLVAQDQDLGVLVPVAHGKNTQDRERVHHRQAGQSYQHSRTSCRDDRVAVSVPTSYRATKPRPRPTDPKSLTCTDEFRHTQRASID